MKPEPAGRLGWCSPGSLLVILLLGFALALLLTLAGLDQPRDFWVELGYTGLFVLWVVLTVLVLTCGLPRRWPFSRWLARPWILFMVIQAVVAAWSLVVVIAVVEWTQTGWLAATDPMFFIWRNLGISVVLGLLLVRYLALNRLWRERLQADSAARLRALQARIRPHFLFNALNTISSLIHDHPDKAEQATMDLSDLLRTGLKDDTHHSLADELELVRGYLRIESLRLGQRLRVEWRMDDDLPLDLSMPVLLIQPLVENAVIHGIARLPAGGRLDISLQSDGRRLRVVIENPIPDDTTAAVAAGSRSALDNIRQRLALAWEEGARLTTQHHDGLFRVELVLPGGR